MEQVINNLALFMLVRYCKENAIDCSDTRLQRIPRTHRYVLVRNSGHPGPVAVLVLSKSAAPYFFHYT